MENEITTFTKWKNYWQVRPLSKCEQFMIIYNTLLFLLNQNIFSSIFLSSSYCPPLIYLPCLCSSTLNRLKLSSCGCKDIRKNLLLHHVNFEDLNNNFRNYSFCIATIFIIRLMHLNIRLRELWYGIFISYILQ